MITNVFLIILEISVSAGLLVLILLLLAPWIGRRYASKWKYWIWIFLGVRLLIPVNGNLVTAYTQDLADQLMGNTGQVKQEYQEQLSDPGAGQKGITIAIPQQLTAPVVLNSDIIPGDFTWLDTAALIWLAGGLIYLAAHLCSYLSFRKRLKKHGTVAADKKMDAQLLELQDSLNIKRRLKYRVTVVNYPQADSPMLIGFFRPCVILPKGQYPLDELYFILKHELVHFKRGDVYIKLLFVLANAIHWFNPFIWLMQKEAAVDMELSCDERVVQDMGFAFRKAYTETLFAVLCSNHTSNTALSTQFYGGKQIMKRRFKNILRKSSQKSGMPLLLGAVALTISLGSVTGCSSLKQEQLSKNTGESKVYADSGVAGGGSEQPEKAPAIENGVEKLSDIKSQKIAPVSAEAEKIEILAYIQSFDSKTLAFDQVEWVSVPSKRASELGAAKQHRDAGFYVYNENTALEELSIAGGCSFQMLDWNASYEPVEMTAEEFRSVLKEREGLEIPYHIYIQDNKVIKIQEQYIP